ncbi:MAG: 2-oxoglutarate dehydrogenase complex dihydrolipoyllysine-residue succinyltransferase [Leptospiraceae bacterium]|nr:2-oxoglutarate dehydrogenase complex dihydrolipoyllysine-residue succinyltransferase [Leptospiraceae bacterium]
MAKSIKVPAMGESITEGTIADWHVSPGQGFQSGDTLVEIETDKVTMEVPAPTSGVLTEILKSSGETVAIDEVIARYEEGSASAGAAPSTAGDATDPTGAVDSAGNQSSAGVPQTGNPNTTVPPGADRLARENQVDPGQLQGTGIRGQVRKADIVQHLQNASHSTKQQSSQAIPEAPPRRLTSAAELETVKPMSRLRQRIAERLVEAQQTAAILTTFNEVDMSRVMALRSQYKEVFKEKYGIGLGFMSFFAHAAVEALKSVPAVNAEIRGTDLIYKNYYDIGVAVGGPKGLVVPVIRGVDQLTFAGFEIELARMAQKVRDGNLALEDMQGGTFTISNGGIYGSMMSTPILNPPQSGILGMHNIVKRPVVVQDEIVIRPMMYIALSYDHRIIDGKEAVTFLVRVKECIENPERLLLAI